MKLLIFSLLVLSSPLAMADGRWERPRDFNTTAPAGTSCDQVCGYNRAWCRLALNVDDSFGGSGVQLVRGLGSCQTATAPGYHSDCLCGR